MRQGRKAMTGKIGGHIATLVLALSLGGCAAGTLAQPAAPRQALPSLISRDDYPLAALRYDLEGQTRVVLSVDENGRVSGCRVTASSGHAILDAATCRILNSRARFTPARDRKGEVVASEYPATVRWALPQAAAPVS